MNLQKSWPNSEYLPKDLILIQDVLFEKCNFEIIHPILQVESSEYGACSFALKNLSVLFRTSKITPTKTGQFVTLWKRINQGPIQPFDSADPIDLFIISTRKDNRFGLFVFPKPIMIEKGIITNGNKEGKRAIRVYPPWDITTNKQAQKTQKWQLDYFIKIPQDQTIDLNRVKRLFLSKD